MRSKFAIAQCCWMPGSSVCRTVALSSIAKLAPELRFQRFFINVSPLTLTDPRFVHGFTRSQIAD